MTRRNWKRYQPATLRDALVGCKDYAAERHNLSVERIAERMGLEDHWAIYKWTSSGRMPVVLVPSYQHACGIDLVTRWLAASSNKLLLDMPLGRPGSHADMAELNVGFAQALQMLSAFYADPASADKDALLDALRGHLEQVAYHRANVTDYTTPQLDLH